MQDTSDLPCLLDFDKMLAFRGNRNSVRVAWRVHCEVCCRLQNMQMRMDQMTYNTQIINAEQGSDTKIMDQYQAID